MTDPAPPPDLPGEATADDSSPDGQAEAPEPVYYALEDWLTGYFLPMFRRTLGGEYRWCHQWWHLMGARGPFYQCSETTHREPHQAETAPSPGDWWDTDPDNPDGPVLPGPPALPATTGATDASI
jgi:hypothetical protein